MTRRTATTIALCYNSLTQIKQVRALIHGFSFSTTTSVTHPPSKTLNNNNTRLALSSIDCSGISHSLISKCSHLLENKGRNFPSTNPTLKDLLFEISDVIPHYTRKLRRVSELKPEHVLDLLLGFQSESENNGFQAKKIQSLWKIFNWAGEKSANFEHLPRSYEVMAFMLLRVRMLREVESLLSTMESRGIPLASQEILSDIVEGYVVEGDIEGAILMYEKMRVRNLVPSLTCYCVFLDDLVRKKRIRMALRVCLDMLEMGFCFSVNEKAAFENVMRLLCTHGKVQEARNLVNRSVALGFEPTNKLLYDISKVYCDKKDFEDLLRFFIEIDRKPDILIGNKIVHSLCNDFGSERARLFMQEMEHIGFKPDEITFGILIGWSCYEGKLKNAFIYFSELLSNWLEPDIRSYHALMSMVLKESLWKYGREIFDEMVERGTKPNFSTLKILLAGYCKAREFDEAKWVVKEMVNCGLAESSLLDDPLSKGFTLLGLNPLAVRLKRDNHDRFCRAEFFDILGNGLYLETDLDEYEKKVNAVLEEFMLTDFNSLVIEESNNDDSKTSLVLAGEMVRWGQELSLSCFSALVKRHSSSIFHFNSITDLWKRNPNLISQLDEKTMNLLVQTYSKNGQTINARIIFGEMVRMKVKVKDKTYTNLMNSLCQAENLRDLLSFLNTAQKDNWVPKLQDSKSLIKYLCKNGKIQEVFLLLESMLVSYSNLRSDIAHIFLESICVDGFSAIAYILLEQLLSFGFVLDKKAYSHLIIRLCKDDNISLALKLLDDILALDLAPCSDASILLIPILCRKGRYKMAVSLKDIVLEEELCSSFSVYTALVEGFCSTGKVGEAISLFNEMLSKGLVPNGEIYNLLVQGHFQVRNYRKVLELIGVMIRKGLAIAIPSYRNLVHVMCKEGRILQALSLKEFVLGHDKSHHYGIIFYNILIFALFASGNGIFINKVLDELEKEKQFLPDEATFKYLVDGFSTCKDISRSKEYLSLMILQGLRPKTRNLNMVITSLCNAGGLEKALELSHEMELRKWIHSSTIQNAIVEGLLSYGKIQEAENFIERMIQKGLVPNNVNYSNLIRQFCRYGKPGKAVNLLDMMLKKGNNPSSVSYDSVIQSFCVGERLDEAMDFQTEMLDRGLKLKMKTWEMLIGSLCKDGKTVEAERALDSMIRIGERPSREMFCSVIDRFRFENNVKKVSEMMQAMQRSGYEPDFETHWSLISNLSNSDGKDHGNKRGFLARLLSESGFSKKRDFT